MSEMIPTFANMRTKNGLIRVQKGTTYLLPLLSESPYDVLYRMMKEENRSMHTTPAFKNDANDLRKKGFVIAHDDQILSSEYLRRQAWGSKLGLDIKKESKRVFLKPIKKIVAQDSMKSKRRAMSCMPTESTIDIRSHKLFREQTVYIHKMDFLSMLSGRAARHIKARLQRLGPTTESAAKDAELLENIKKMCIVFKNTPMFQARCNPFRQQIASVQFIDTKELGLSDFEESTTPSLRHSDPEYWESIVAEPDKILTVTDSVSPNSHSYTDTSDHAV